MTEKELRKMSRAELIEIIYRYEQTLQELTAERNALAEQIKDRSIRLQEAGSIAEASLALNRVFESAQQAAEQYVVSVRAAYEQAESEAQDILEQARQDADALRKKGREEYEEKMAQAERECSGTRRESAGPPTPDLDWRAILEDIGEAEPEDG